ncbi:MAG: lytic transglycosylase domain-containing protein, partial [Sphingomicrobium sp.]
MSSMWRTPIILSSLLAIPGSGSAQYAGQAYGYTSNISGWINSWRTLRQSSGYHFSDYAGLLIANPDWPDSAKLRRWAEKAMQPGENGMTVIAFFAHDKPRTGTGWARLADALSAAGRATEALDAARNGWASSDLSATDEQAIWARYGGSFTTADHDRRTNALLSAKNADDAARFVPISTPARQAAFGARVQMLRNAADADSRYQAVMGSVTSDAGLMMDRIRWLRANNLEQPARQLAARTHNFVDRPADPERFYELLSILAANAAQDRQWSTAFNIASQIDDVLAPGTRAADQSLGIRDDYTTLAWLAGTVALDRLNRPSSALAMFDRYASGGRSLQVLTKGTYWAGRAALAAGQTQTANAYFQRAAAYPDLFYGQLSLERLGRSVPAPPQALAQYTTTAAQRAAFNSRPLMQAVRTLGQQGRTAEQALFVRALAESLDTDSERNLAVEASQQLRRPDLAVWTARAARIKGSEFYVRQAFPSLSGSVSPSLWSLAHAISRQESSFDPYALSPAGAR